MGRNIVVADLPSKPQLFMKPTKFEDFGVIKLSLSPLALDRLDQWIIFHFNNENSVRNLSNNPAHMLVVHILRAIRDEKPYLQLLANQLGNES